MRKQSAIVLVTLISVVGCAIPGGVSHGGPTWELDDRVAEVEVARSGHIRSIRFDGEEEFTPVEHGVVPSIVDGLAFYGRDLPLAAYFTVRDGVEYLALWNPWWCRLIFKEFAEIVGSIFIELPYELDDPMIIKYPQQTVTISERGEAVDFGGGPELLTVWFAEEPVTEFDFYGFRKFTLFEFFEEDTRNVISRNVVIEEPFD